METQQKTPAARLLFQLQLMGLLLMTGRDEEASAAYQEAQRLAQQLVDVGQ